MELRLHTNLTISFDCVATDEPLLPDGQYNSNRKVQGHFHRSREERAQLHFRELCSFREYSFGDNADPVSLETNGK